ncbi:MAG: DNA mismatch repair endonuclease MutL [Paraglaciecola sp.]|nr:DNA mismatch repair endonuclease MutL [Paraglaciecola sp.]NCT47380.1 DNA mismatch repair endonuclease MutL [Paraglaciecola sp.]
MPIQILPARLANQIAAGEVVERPASVVKELVENSLDAGANQIDIEIEQGGHKSIIIRDNGCGIPHDELTLALSRHATSKITTLDDLEHIHSLGFRGEALASISSVARLTLSSKPADQGQAWQAHCEGRDMAVQLNPVAHPNGSSVEVLDLFFNTPARRKFLRAEKTEFAHIDEIIRRIALSRFDVGFSLKHNGKLLRKYAASAKESNDQKRLQGICGKEFAEQALNLNSQYQGFQLKGWIAPPDSAKPLADCQYFYVNGRMMRDRLLNHAVRQALEGVISADHQLAYVLYLSLDASEVDVNVHPAKHEVRFHQARLVHDFVFRALNDALDQYFSSAGVQQSGITELANVAPNHHYIAPLETEKNRVAERQLPEDAVSSTYAPASGKPAYAEHTSSRPPHSPQLATAAQHYQALMSAPNPLQHTPDSVEASGVLLIDQEHLLVGVATEFYVLPVRRLLNAQMLRDYAKGLPLSQPLLLPISLSLGAQTMDKAKKLASFLQANNIEIAWQDKRVILRQIPAGMRHYNWALILESLLDKAQLSNESVLQTLTAELVKQHPILNAQTIIQLWQQQTQAADIGLFLHREGVKVPLSKWIKDYV